MKFRRLLSEEYPEESMEVRSAPHLKKFQHMQSAVRQIERGLAQRRGKKRGPAFFETSAPHRGIYAPLPVEIFTRHLERHPELKPGFAVADLGSGLGELCFAASFTFRKVVGYEMDPELIGEADNIRQLLDFQNVSFRREDFLKADLSEFDALIVFQPFLEDFAPLITWRLLNTRPGTHIISGISSGIRREIFDGDNFRRIAAAGGTEKSWQTLLETYLRI
jgi:hypothetical protein